MPTNSHSNGHPDWVKRALETRRFHVAKLRMIANWRIQDTAEILERSIGSVSQDLLLAFWLIKDDEVVKFPYVRDAIDYCRKKQRQSRIDA